MIRNEGIEEAIWLRLGTEPLTDKHSNWVAGGEPMNNNDECWFVAHVDLDRAPQRVVVKELACYSDQPEDTSDDAVVGRAKIDATTITTPNGSDIRLVLNDISIMVAPS